MKSADFWLARRPARQRTRHDQRLGAEQRAPIEGFGPDRLARHVFDPAVLAVIRCPGLCGQHAVTPDPGERPLSPIASAVAARVEVVFVRFMRLLHR